jgi:tetratricopeptide (TPR) repeat protein
MTGLHSYRIGIILAVIAGIMAISATSCRSGDKQQIESYNSYNLGVKAVKANNLDLAGNYFKKAVILNPDFTEARLNLANINFLKGNLDEARDEYIKLLEEKQYDPRLLFNLGWIYLKQENYETAAELFRKSRRVDPSFTDSDYGLAMLAHAQNEDALTKFHLQNYIANSTDGRWSKKANEVLNSLASDEGIIEETEISTTETTDSQSVEIPETAIR